MIGRMGKGSLSVWVWLAAALLAVAAASLLVSRLSAGGERAGVPTLRLTAEPFVRRVTAEGNLRAARAQPIGVPSGIPGPFQVAWVAPDGAPVRAGDVVVRFDASKIEKDLGEAVADRDSAGLKSDKQRTDSAARIANLRRDAAMAELELENAQRFQKKDEQLFSRFQIIESDIDEALARARERHARQNERTQMEVGEAELQILEISRRQAEMRIRRAEGGLAALEILAPFDGVLVLERNWRGETVRVGDTVWNNQLLAQIPDLSQMQAEVFVLEADAGGLAPGKPAEVRLESEPDAVYRGKIARVDTLAKPRLRGSPVQYFGVTVELERTDARRMKPGQRVRAVLTLDERPRAFTLPRQAVFEREGRLVVFKKKGSGFEAVPVTLGPAGLGRVVIESGLTEGDVVALADPEEPAAGTPDTKEAGEPAAPSAKEAGGGA